MPDIRQRTRHAWDRSISLLYSMDKPRLLWVDLTVTVRHAELSDVFTESCDIEICDAPSNLYDKIERGDVNGVCFDMDYPDHSGLDLMRKTKARYPQLPVLLLTLQHSESLAVWAFRSRVLDYLVKPVSRMEFHRCIQTLRTVMDIRITQPSRSLVDSVAPIPAEIPLGMRSDDVRLLPALYYVKKNFCYKIKNEAVAKLCDMSPFRFSRAFRESYGITFQEYVVRYRILEACRLLTNPESNVTDVAYAVGFNDASYFARTFRRYVGTSPSSYSGEFKTPEALSVDTAYLKALLQLPDDRQATALRAVSKAGGT